MKTKFSKTDLGCVIGDDWDIFGNRVQVFDDSLRPTDTENPVLPFPFTLEQFRAFCDWHPTFQWEAIESVFTNDDGSLDDAAIGSLNPASGAADLVRAVLATHDAEFQLAWRIHEQLDQCRAQIERWERLEQNAPTPSEAIAAEGKLAGLRAELAGLLRQLSGTAQEHPQATVSQPQAAPDLTSASTEQNESVQTMQRARTKETLEDFLMPYLVKVFRSGTYRSGKEFHRALVSKAGADDSPFKAGTGLTNALYVTERGQTLADSTLNRLMRRVRQEAAR